MIQINLAHFLPETWNHPFLQDIFISLSRILPDHNLRMRDATEFVIISRLFSKEIQLQEIFKCLSKYFRIILVARDI